jgi:hypothetical protein
LILLGLVLAGYALAGRGFAYLGYPPLFVGEVTLAAGVLVLLSARGWSAVWQMPSIIALAAFCGLGLGHTAFDYREYGMDALRDSAIYYYGAFAFIVAGLLAAEPRRLLLVLGCYRRFAPIFLVGILIVALLYRGMHESLPQWPWTGAPVLQEKEGDVMVHLGGILVFWAVGLSGAVLWVWPVLLAINASALSVVDRAGLLSFGMAMAASIVRNVKAKTPWMIIGVSVAAVFLLFVTKAHIPIPGGKGRELSFDQVMTNITSITSDSGSEGMDSTKEWRLSWWKDIVAENLTGRFMWTGRGFGINLADEYGYQVQADHSLRSPHSAHMTVLARMGAPGLALWIILQLTWAWGIVRSYWISRQAGDPRWQGVFFFLGIYWFAFLLNASFDVYLEGPMGGIWFWTVYGVGAAAMWIYERRPEVMYG